MMMREKRNPTNIWYSLITVVHINNFLTLAKLPNIFICFTRLWCQIYFCPYSNIYVIQCIIIFPYLSPLVFTGSGSSLDFFWVPGMFLTLLWYRDNFCFGYRFGSTFGNIALPEILGLF